MSQNASVGRILTALAMVAVLPLGAVAQGTSAASISGVVTDGSGGVVPDVAIEVSSPVLIEKVRTARSNERGEYRIVELRPGTYTVTFTRQGFAPFRREGLELTSNFAAAVDAELRVGAVEQSVTVSGTSPLVDTRNVARQTVISKTLLDAVPTGKNLLSFYSLTPAAVTPTNAQGESGTGKEVMARFIHGLSPHRRGPFVAINCAALPESLVESELFGFERGAFTGARQSKSGQIELANGGVLFLDEVTEMPLMAQAKFLRVLQEREVMRLGGTRPIKVNVRVIAATNQDLRRAVAQGRFREDLYYRINVFEISMSPLRQRGLDVLLLAEHFLEEFARTNGGPEVQLTSNAQDALLAYHWPGNVRELRNVLERATIVCEGRVIDTEHLLLAAPTEVPLAGSTNLETLERHAIEQALRDVAGNKRRAAQRLGISRTQLYSRLRKYGLEGPL